MNTRQKKIKELILGKDKYAIGFLDDSLNIPILLGLEDVKLIRQRFKHKDLDTRARELFNWVHSNVSYGKDKRGIFRAGYRTAKETLVGKEGVCGEMSYLYVAAARVAGLKSNYVSVIKDYEGRRVCHACSAVYVPQLKFADVAYHQYGINHEQVEILNDREMLKKFSSWR